MNKQISIVLSNATYRELKRLSGDEKRSVSGMGSILIEEALKARKPAKQKTKSKSKSQ